MVIVLDSPQSRGARLRAMREAAGLTLRDVERLIQLNQSSLSRLEKGETPLREDNERHMALIQQLAARTNAEPDWVWTGTAFAPDDIVNRVPREFLPRDRPKVTSEAIELALEVLRLDSVSKRARLLAEGIVRDALQRAGEISQDSSPNT